VGGDETTEHDEVAGAIRESGGREMNDSVGSRSEETHAFTIEALARTTPMAIIVIDGDGIVRSWNEGGFELLGIRPGDALGRLLSDLIVPPSLRRAHEAGLARVRHTGRSDRLGGTFSMPALHADGTTVVHELTLTAIAVGGQEWYLGVIRDPARAGDRSHAVPRSRYSRRFSNERRR
jgi:PAS domain S-box-containing protein